MTQEQMPVAESVSVILTTLLGVEGLCQIDPHGKPRLIDCNNAAGTQLSAYLLGIETRREYNRRGWRLRPHQDEDTLIRRENEALALGCPPHRKQSA